MPGTRNENESKLMENAIPMSKFISNNLYSLNIRFHLIKIIC